jgi:hypothetical protein
VIAVLASVMQIDGKLSVNTRKMEYVVKLMKYMFGRNGKKEIGGMVQKLGVIGRKGGVEIHSLLVFAKMIR